jgi:hypothetical protein
LIDHYRSRKWLREREASWPPPVSPRGHDGAVKKRPKSISYFSPLVSRISQTSEVGDRPKTPCARADGRRGDCGLPESGEQRQWINFSLHIQINLDELWYDPANRRRIQQYTNNSRKEGEIRQIYLTRGPYRPQPRFKCPQKLIANAPWRFNPVWFK